MTYRIEDNTGNPLRYYGAGAYGWLEHSSTTGEPGLVVEFERRADAERWLAGRADSVFFRAAAARVTGDYPIPQFDDDEGPAPTHEELMAKISYRTEWESEQRIAARRRALLAEDLPGEEPLTGDEG